jgi:hypothetical protein
MFKLKRGAMPFANEIGYQQIHGVWESRRNELRIPTASTSFCDAASFAHFMQVV